MFQRQDEANSKSGRVSYWEEVVLGSSSKPGASLLSSLSCSMAAWTTGHCRQAKGSTKDSAVFLGLSFKAQRLISQHDKAPTSLKDLAPFNRQFKPNFTFFLFLFPSCFYQQFPLWTETMNEPTPRTAGFWRVWGQKCHEGDISV